jgi:hypothetical protein
MKKIILLFIILLIVGAYLIKTNNNLDVENKGDQKTFIKLFTDYIFQLFTNAKDLTTLAIQQTWLPENKTNGS